jgi:hypothetical protein
MKQRYAINSPTPQGLATLEKARLISAIYVSDPSSYPNSTGTARQVKTFQFTAEGDRIATPVPNDHSDPYEDLNAGQAKDLCYGQASISEVVDWDRNQAISDYTSYVVNYKYKLKDVPSWVNNSEITSAFPDIKPAIDSGEGKSKFILLEVKGQWRVVEEPQLPPSL